MRDYNEDRVLEQSYFHIGNSGLTVKLVQRKYGPKLVTDFGAHGEESVHEISLSIEVIDYLIDALPRFRERVVTGYLGGGLSDTYGHQTVSVRDGEKVQFSTPRKNYTKDPSPKANMYKVKDPVPETRSGKGWVSGGTGGIFTEEDYAAQGPGCSSEGKADSLKVPPGFVPTK